MLARIALVASLLTLSPLALALAPQNGPSTKDSAKDATKDSAKDATKNSTKDATKDAAKPAASAAKPAAATDAAGVTARPNFIFIQAEATGWSSTSVDMDGEPPSHARPAGLTPNLEQLAQDVTRHALLQPAHRV